MQKLAIALAIPALALAATPAGALTTATFSASFGTYHSTTNVNVPGTLVSRTISLPLFGSVAATEGIVAPVGYGTQLQGIHLVLDASLSSDGRLINNSPASAWAWAFFDISLRANIAPPIDNSWKATISNAPSEIGVSYIFKAAGENVFYTESGVGPPPYTIAPNGGIWDPPQTNDDQSRSTDLVGLAITGGDWFDRRFFDIVYSLRAVTVLQGEADSGTGDFNTIFSTGTWGHATIYYDYDFIPTPSPAPLALVIVGLAVLGLNRRLRTSG